MNETSKRGGASVNDDKIYLCLTPNGKEYMTEEQIYREVQKVASQILRKHYWGYRDYHEDLIQDAAMELFNALHRYNPDRGEINGFIFGVASRVISTQIKRIIRIQSKTVSMTDEMQAVLSAPDNTEEDTDYIAEFEKRLTARERRVLEMKLDGMNNTEIYNALHRTKKKRIGKAMLQIWKSIESKYKKFKEEQDGND